jgi:hypothetical protein
MFSVENNSGGTRECKDSGTGCQPFERYRVFIDTVAEPELHHVAGAVTRCGSGKGIKHGKEFKNDTKCNSLEPIQLIFSAIKIVQNHFALLYSRVGAAEPVKRQHFAGADVFWPGSGCANSQQNVTKALIFHTKI